MIPLLAYWTQFKHALIHELDSLDDSVLSNAWKSASNRTALYDQSVIQNVAKQMELEFVKEDFKIDYTLCKNVDNYMVPLIFIESENDARSADHEIRKLSCMNAPLKVLIICTEWSDESGFWSHGGEKRRLSEQWAKQIKAHGSVWASNSITAVVIAEWKDELRYYSFVCNSNGEMIEDHEIFFSRSFSKQTI